MLLNDVYFKVFDPRASCWYERSLQIVMVLIEMRNIQ